MATIQAILEQKGFDVLTIRPAETVYNAIKSMEEHNISALLVMENDKLLGIVTERDYARKVILKGRSSHDTKVSEIMTGNVLMTSAEKNNTTCLAVMNKHHIRHLPVVREGSVIGLISIGDLAKSIIDEQQHLIESLEHAVSWSESY
ncbi:MAG: CBS domain-containing protein [Chromatiales bacterium]|nr:CBS domain-containing protein [Chromatiales bacterium]